MTTWVFVDWVCVILFSFFGLYLLVKKDQCTYNKLIAAFLLLLATSYTLFLLRSYYDNDIINSIKTLRYFDMAIYFLLNPLLYFYTLSLLNNKLKFTKNIFWHFLPFIVFLFSPNINSYIKAIYPVETLYMAEINISALIIQTLLYQLQALRVVSSYKKRFSLSERIKGRYVFLWLKIVLWGILLLWELDFGIRFIYHLGMVSWDWIYIDKIISLITYMLILFTGLYFGEVFSNIEIPSRYHYSQLREEEKIKTLKKLEFYVLQEKSFLNPDINLETLANELKIKPRDLSQVINEKLNKNFKEYINSYRLEESILQLKNKNLASKTILEILYDSGFNSKSSFYSLFEKHTGQSPTQFRKIHLRKK